MGYAKDSMDSYIKRDINKKYPASEGWKIQRDSEWDGIAFDYAVSRRQYGKLSRYLIDVVIEKTVSRQYIDDLVGKLNVLDQKNVLREGVFIIVPTGADTSQVPDEIGVMYLKVLKVIDDDILWWRKPSGN